MSSEQAIQKLSLWPEEGGWGAATAPQDPKCCRGEAGLTWVGIIPMARLGPVDSSSMKTPLLPSPHTPPPPGRSLDRARVSRLAPWHSLFPRPGSLWSTLSRAGPVSPQPRGHLLGGLPGLNCTQIFVSGAAFKGPKLRQTRPDLCKDTHEGARPTSITGPRVGANLGASARVWIPRGGRCAEITKQKAAWQVPDTRCGGKSSLTLDL